MLHIHKKKQNVRVWRRDGVNTITATTACSTRTRSIKSGGKHSCPTSHNVNFIFNPLQLDKLKAKVAKFEAGGGGGGGKGGGGGGGGKGKCRGGKGKGRGRS